jgi:tetratricopeptide (TPR) repeat protein
MKIKIVSTVCLVSALGGLFVANSYAQTKSTTTATQTQLAPDENSASDSKFSKDLKDTEDYLKTIRDFKRNSSFIPPENTAIHDAMAKSLSEEIEKLKKSGDTNGVLQVSGQLCRINGDPDCAIDAFSKVIGAAGDGSYKAYISADLGLVFFDKGDKSAASKYFKSVVDAKIKDKPYAAVELGVKLGKMAEAKALFEEWIAYKRSKTPFFVARTPECDAFEKAGTPIAGCFNQKLFVCFNRSKTDEPMGDCSEYKGEIEFLKTADFCKTCNKQK